jgi:hypothetical protein
MRRNEEAERLVKQEDVWNKENRLTKEEQVASWATTVEALEKIYKHFYSYKDYRLGKFKPKPVWLCEGEHKDEDKEKSKKEVVGILKLCKKEHILINNPAIANLMYVNRLIKRGFAKEEDEMLVSVGEQSMDDKPTVHPIVCERADLNSDKRMTEIAASNVITSSLSTTPQNAARSDDLGDLQKYCDAGIKLIGVYSNGSQIASGTDIETAYTCDPDVIRNLSLGKDPRTKGQKMNRFYFRPSHCGLLCIDIDIKNGKDGLAEFYNFCKRKGKSKRHLPKELQELPDSFSCYTITPNSGYHLYFKHAWTQKQQQQKKSYCLCSGVEITYQLTAAGSFKEGKPYTLHGDIPAAPTLPKFIETAIFSTEIIKKKTKELNGSFQNKKNGIYKTSSKKDWGKPSWQQITQWSEEDNPSEISIGRNARAFYLAVHAKTHGYSEYETLNEIRNDPTVNSLPEREIQTIVRSVYKK